MTALAVAWWLLIGMGQRMWPVWAFWAASLLLLAIVMRIEELSLDVIGETMRRVPVTKYLEHRVAMLAKLGKGPDGKPLKKSSGGAKAKASPAAAKRKTAKKKTAAKRR